LLSPPQNNLAGKRPMTQKFLATPLHVLNMADVLSNIEVLVSLPSFFIIVHIVFRIVQISVQQQIKKRLNNYKIKYNN
jgi:hypothetical protein